MADKIIYIVYRNRFDEVKAYKLKLIGQSADEIYTYAYDVIEEKPKTFVTNNIISHNANKEEAEKTAKKEQEKFTPKTRNVTIGGLENFTDRKGNKEGKREVLFTGFSSLDKNKLIKLAEKHDYYVPTQVTENLYLLVCGKNFGPSKLEKARKRNVAIVYDCQGFLDFFETGEITE